MPKSKPKPKKSSTSDEKNLSAEEDKNLSNDEEKQEAETIKKPVDAPQNQTIEEDIISTAAFGMATGLRFGLEYWKMQTFGKVLFDSISRAYVAWNLESEIKTDNIFKKIEQLHLDVVKDIEMFESVLFPEIETFLARKKIKQ